MDELADLLAGDGPPTVRMTARTVTPNHRGHIRNRRLIPCPVATCRRSFMDQRAAVQHARAAHNRRA